MRQSEPRDPAQTVALVLPGDCGLHEVDLLVDQFQLHPRKSGRNHLQTEQLPKQTKNVSEKVQREPRKAFFIFCFYLLQLLDEGVDGGVGFGRARHVHVKLIAIGQSIQAQHQFHIFLEQAGLWIGQKKV